MDIHSVPRIERREAPALATEEYRRFANLASELSSDEWSRPTDCPGWTVRDVVAHVAGSMAGTSLREGSRQRKVASQRSQESGRLFLDEMNQLHIDERADQTPEALKAELRDRISPAVRARRLVPGLLRRAPLPNSGDPPMRMGELLDVILTRSVWMHRVDVCRATDRPLQLTPHHDGRLVADVVRDWADRHGQPFTLRLTGPVGGTFTRAGKIQGPNGPSERKAQGPSGPSERKATPDIELDAVEFCRTLSGRAPAEGLLATSVVF